MNHRRPPSLPNQLSDLFLVELTSYRWAWRSMVITGMVAPLTFVVAMGIFARDSGPEALSYVLVGNIVLSLMFETLNRLASHFAYIRFAGTLDYFATLPIHRLSLILAAVLAFLLLSLPALAVTILGGALLLRVPIHPHPLLLLVIPLAAMPLAGFGALIGTSARTPEEAGSLSTLFTLLLLALGPVLIPPGRLPPLLATLGWFSPATYAASALRQVLIGPLTGRVLLDLLVLSGFTLLAFWLVAHTMDWRQT